MCSTDVRHKTCKECFGVDISEKRPLGRATHRRKDNIEMDLQDVGWVE